MTDGVSVEEYRKALRAVKRAEQKAIRESLENEMLRQIEEAELPAPVQQFKHVKGRAYRLDFAWPALHLGLEVDGGITSYQPSHASAGGILRDIEKHNSGIVNGWTVLRVHTGMLWDGSAIALVKTVFELVQERVASSR